MSRIALVTDTTADLTKEIKRKYNVHVVPLKVHLRIRVFRSRNHE